MNLIRTARNRGLRPRFLAPECSRVMTTSSMKVTHPIDDDYEEEPAPSRRSGSVIVIAVLGLTVLGTAGVMGYRAMFGGSMLPSMPPIIRPAEGPTKISPDTTAQATPNTADVTRGGGDKLVAHQEQPVEVPPANPAPRVVATIPVVASSPNAAWPGAQPAATPAPPAAAGPSAPPLPAANAAPEQAPPASLAAQSAPKRVQTVAIRPNQGGGANQGAHAARGREPASAGPLAIVPTQQPTPAPAPVRSAMAHPAAPETVSAAGGGRYAVQVSSQRSEADAQSAFRSLQAKFPQQLGGRQPIVRRAELAGKGTFYRALVGPFASAQEAAGLCSSLKAAGGNCLIQRN